MDPEDDVKTKLIAFALAALGISAGIVAMSVSTRADAGLNGLEARLGLCPPSSTFVLSVDIDGLRRSPLYEKYAGEREQALEREHPALQSFVAETGLDPSRDIATLLLAAQAADKSGDCIGIVTGRFEPERIQARLRRGGVTTEKWNGQLVFRVKKDDAELRPDLCLAFLGREAVAFGSESAVRTLLARYRGGADTGFLSDPRNRDLLAAADTRGQVFGIVRTGDVMKAAGAALDGAEGTPLAALNSFKSISTLTFSLSVASDVDVSARAVCQKPEDAALVHDALKGLIAMGKLASQEKERDVAAALDLAQVQDDGAAVTFSMRIPGATIEHFHEKALELHQKRLHPEGEEKPAPERPTASAEQV